MTRYGYAMRIGGDRDIAGALKTGIERGTTSSALRAPSPEGEGRGTGGRTSSALRAPSPKGEGKVSDLIRPFGAPSPEGEGKGTERQGDVKFEAGVF